MGNRDWTFLASVALPLVPDLQPAVLSHLAQFGVHSLSKALSKGAINEDSFRLVSIL